MDDPTNVEAFCRFRSTSMNLQCKFRGGFSHDSSLEMDDRWSVRLPPVRANTAHNVLLSTLPSTLLSFTLEFLAPMSI